MKTVILMYEFLSEYGGIERVMLSEARALKKKGYNAKFAFAYVDNRLREKLKGFEVIEYGKTWIKNEPLQIISALVKTNFFKKLKCDLIVCHSFPSASYTAYRMHKKFKIPYIQFIHHYPQFLYNSNASWANNTWKRRIAFFAGKIIGSYLRKIDKNCVQNAGLIIVNSKMVQKTVKSIYNRNGIICYPPVDSLFMEKKNDSGIISRKYNLPKEFILASGRIVPLKKFEYLIQAVAQLKNKQEIIFAGKCNESYTSELQEMANKLEVRIKFLGEVGKDLKGIYSAAKLTVLTCPKEYFGMVPIEAMACGCPVIAWADQSGPQETVINGINGYLAQPYKTEDLSIQIKKALEKKWNKSKIKKSVDKFSEEKIGNQFISIIKRV